MRTIRLGNVEQVAVSGIAWRFQTETQQAIDQRNQDILRIFAEHGVHRLPASYQLRVNSQGYVDTIEWDDQEDAQVHDCDQEGC